MLKVTQAAPELAEVCRALYRIAQKHTPASAFADINELMHVASILKTCGAEPVIADKFKALTADHVPAVARQSAAYRLLRAQFRAALSTIADLGRKSSKTHKTAFHAGAQAGLQRAAKIAIMFLADFEETDSPNNSTSNFDDNIAAKSSKIKAGHRLVR